MHYNFKRYGNMSSIENALHDLSDSADDASLRKTCCADYSEQTWKLEITVPPVSDGFLRRVKADGCAIMTTTTGENAIAFVVVPGKGPRFYHVNGGRDGLTVVMSVSAFKTVKRINYEPSSARRLILAPDHPLADLLPLALKLDHHAIQELNRMLPGIIYEMPIIRDEVLRQSKVAFLSPDTRRARIARDWLASVACPIGRTTAHPVRTARILKVLTMIYEDIVLLREIYRRECRLADHADVLPLIKRAFSDVPEKYLRRACSRDGKPTIIAADALGEMIGARGRGLRNQWEKTFARHAKATRERAVQTAASVNLA